MRADTLADTTAGRRSDLAVAEENYILAMAGPTRGYLDAVAAAKRDLATEMPITSTLLRTCGC